MRSQIKSLLEKRCTYGSPRIESFIPDFELTVLGPGEGPQKPKTAEHVPSSCFSTRGGLWRREGVCGDRLHVAPKPGFSQRALADLRHARPESSPRRPPTGAFVLSSPLTRMLRYLVCGGGRPQILATQKSRHVMLFVDFGLQRPSPSRRTSWGREKTNWDEKLVSRPQDVLGPVSF